MPRKTSPAAPAPLEPMIVRLRDQPVILDADLARVYGGTTKVLNQAVKRNAGRFPEDFAFQLHDDEAATLMSQIVTSSSQLVDSKHSNRSQIVTSSQKHRDPRYLPWAFTEHGALMAANILRSAQAARMSVYLIRAFVRLRQQSAANADILRRIAEIDGKLLEHDEALVVVSQKLQSMLRPPAPKPRIGFRS